MGWASGAGVFDGVWSVVRPHIPEGVRAEVCAQVIKSLEQDDWDTQSDCVRDEWPEVEESLRALHPNWYEDED